MTEDAAAMLAALGNEYFEVVHTIDPFTATQPGVAGFDRLVPDPSRDGAAEGARRIASVQSRLAEQDLGARFDIRKFHGDGAVPLGVLDQVVSRRIRDQAA